MSVPPELSAVASAAIRNGYRWELDRAIRANAYLRVFFSVMLLMFAGFGPGLLMRFPVSVGGVRLDTVSQFYAYRPVVFTLVFVALVCVLAALARRAFEFFRAALEEDTGAAGGERERYIRHLKPGSFPFVLSGNLVVDGVISIVVLIAYCFWVVILVETIPLGMISYQVVGIVMGAYGIFGAIIVTVFIWAGLAARGRRLLAAPSGAVPTESPPPA